VGRYDRAEADQVISHPDKVLFPDDGITKGDLAAYYEAIAPVMLPHINARPVTMERFPNGIGQPGFLQKDLSRGFPAWLERVEVPKKGGLVRHERTRLLAARTDGAAAIGGLRSL
jgi:bifunctional non-homologous end joining protein LigD